MDAFQKNVKLAMNQLISVAENNVEKSDINNGLGEITIDGVEYQIQLSFIVDKRLWVKEDEVRYSECVKVHPHESLQ